MAVVNCTEAELVFKAMPTRKGFVDLTGTKFSSLLVLGYAGFINNPSWFCKCDCGIIKIFQAQRLRSGANKSCGCISRKEQAVRMTKHGQRANKGKFKSSEYKAWSSACERCRNPNLRCYPDYGGRGIEMRFETFTHFIEHIGFKPSPTDTLDRIDVDGHYEHGNVRWVSMKVQQRNRRVCVTVDVDGLAMQINDWIDSRLGSCDEKTYGRIRGRIRNGWCMNCSIEKGIGYDCEHKTNKKHL